MKHSTLTMYGLKEFRLATQKIAGVTIMEDLGLYTLNGRTTGDYPGNFTFHNKNGRSIIDLAWGNVYLLDTIKKLEFIETLDSDHSIGFLKFKESQIPSNIVEENKVNTFSVTFKFDDNRAICFQNFLNQANEIYFNSNHADKFCENLIGTTKMRPAIAV